MRSFTVSLVSVSSLIVAIGCSDDAGPSALDSSSSGADATSSTTTDDSSDTASTNESGPLPSTDSSESGDGSTGDDVDPPACTFERIDVGVTTSLLSVWGASADEVWIGSEALPIGAPSSIFRVQGASVESYPTLATDSVWTIHGRAADDVWFAGNDPRLGHLGIAHWDGADVELAYEAPTFDATIEGVWAVSPTEAWAGGLSTLLRFDGESWSAPAVDPFLDISMHRIMAIAGSAPDDVLFLSSFGRILRWNGSEVAEAATGPSLQALVHADGGSYWGIQTDPGLLFKSADGNEWEPVAALTDDDENLRPQAIAASSDDDLWLLTAQKGVRYVGTFVDHFDGAEWVRTPIGDVDNPVFARTIALAGSSVWVVGEGGYVGRCIRE